MSGLPAAARFLELDALLQQALELEPSRRPAWLTELAARDADAAARVQRLLIASAATEPPDCVAGGMDHLAGTTSALREGTRIGDWRLESPLGTGGMAEVWLARRDDGVYVQRAALKRLAPGMATPDLVARFEQERQILASFEDAGVARLLDGGLDAQGLPWLALEFVDGEDIVRWCDRQRVPLARRLQLWREVAATVARAHRRLIVHRDLKPSNVLVDTGGRTRLLDFGIAKLLDASAQPHAAPPTRAGTRALTPEYASPEQLLGDAVAVASDVYQLGLLLYLLLCGHHPFRRAGVTASEHERRIVQELPERPSRVALQDTGEGEAQQRAGQRASTPAALARALRGDLDLIALRALAKTPAERYATVDEFSDDVRRHQQREPIRAHPPSLRYRALRFAQRQRVLLLVALAALAATGVFVATTLRHAAELQRESAVNRAVREYVLSLFQEADPGLTGARQLTAAQMLERGARQASTALAGQPDVQTEMLSLLAQVYLARFEPDRALPLATQALQLQRSSPESRPEALAAAVYSAAVTHLYLGELLPAEALAREAAALRQRLYGIDTDATRTAQALVGAILHHRGEFDTARRYLEDALGEGGRGPLRLQNQHAIHELADVERDAGNFQRALVLYGEIITLQMQDRGEAGVAAMVDGDYGRCLLLAGRIDEAREHLRRGAAKDRGKFGELHMATAIHARNLALLEEHLGDAAAAATNLRRALAIYERTLPATHFYAAQIRLDLGYALLQLGDAGAASAPFAQALRDLMALRPQGHPAAASAALGAALTALAHGDDAAAQAAAGQAVTRRAQALGEHHAYTEAARWLRAAVSGDDAAPDAQTASAAPFEVARLQRSLAAARQVRAGAATASAAAAPAASR